MHAAPFQPPVPTAAVHAAAPSEAAAVPIFEATAPAVSAADVDAAAERLASVLAPTPVHLSQRLFRLHHSSGTAPARAVVR